MMILDRLKYKKYISFFSENDQDPSECYISNASVWNWMNYNVPFFECPDKTIEEIYYFRWWSYRKHIRKTPEGFVITEFLPDVSWAGKYNTINCPAGHHLYEGRWIREQQYLEDYSKFWFSKDGEPRKYSFWAADAIFAHFMVSGKVELPLRLLKDLSVNYEAWESEHMDESGLFWQLDDRDGMELTIGGSGLRPTINSYMYADALAISKIAKLAGYDSLAFKYRSKAVRIKELVQDMLWDKEKQFFKTFISKEASVRHRDFYISWTEPGELAVQDTGSLANVMELVGYVPWCFNLPDPGFEKAWKYLMDEAYFSAPFGLTTAERGHKHFMHTHEHECAWDGPSWPFATSQTLTAMANLLNNYNQQMVSKRDYYEMVSRYAKSHHIKFEDGRVLPWIDENLDPFSGEWIAHKKLHGIKDPNCNRGMYYNHSTFCDLVISGLVGIRPSESNIVEVNPLITEDIWDYFCLENVFYHGRNITILYDRNGSRYNRGRGLQVLVDGETAAKSEKLDSIKVEL